MNHRKNNTGAITGSITDSRSGSALFDVAIAVKGQDKNGKTDVRGKFRIDGVEAGSCELDCDLMGYQKHRIKDLFVEPGKTTKCACQMDKRYTPKLDKLIALFPLKLEILKIAQQADSPMRVAEFKKTALAASASQFNNLRQDPELPVIKSLEATEPQYWIRWYPDDIHHLTPIGQITEQEKEDWKNVYDKYRELTNNIPEEENSSEQDAFWTVEDFEKLIDFENSDLKQEWLKLADKYGVARARQIAKFHTTEPTWDFDQQFPIRINLSFQQDLENGSFSSELRNELRNQHQLQFSTNVSVRNSETAGLWRIIDIEEGIEMHARLAQDAIELLKYSDDGSEAFDLVLNRGMPCPSLPDEIHLYTVKERKIEGPLLTVAVQREEIRLGLGNLESTKWIDDFDEALTKGMGVKVSDAEKVKKIDEADWLIAVGLNEGENSRAVFEEIMRRSNAAGEFAIFPQDSPTNNSDLQNTDHEALETDIEQHLQKTKFRLTEQNVPKDLCDELSKPVLDAQRLQNLLKLENSTISEMPGAELAEMTEATAMAVLLWKPCIETLKPRLMITLGLTANDWDKVENFFFKHIRARGIFPVLKFDENPYGLLPVMALLDYAQSEPESSVHGMNLSIQELYANLVKGSLLATANTTPRIDSVSEQRRYEILEQILQNAPVSGRISVDLQRLGCRLVKENSQEQPTDKVPYPELGYLNEFSNPEMHPECFFIDEKSPLLKRLLKYLLHLEHGVSFNSPPPRVKGKVFNSTTGQGLPGARVSLEGTDFSVATDGSGNYSIENVPLGTYVVRATAKPFAPVLRTNIKIGKCPDIDVNFNLFIKVQDAIGSSIGQMDGLKKKKKGSGSGSQGDSISGLIRNVASNMPAAGIPVKITETGDMTFTDDEGYYNFGNLPAESYQIVIGDEGSTASFRTEFGLDTYVIDFDSTEDTSYDKVKCNLPQLAANVLKGVAPEKVEILLLETMDLLSHRLDAWLTGLSNEKLHKCQAKSTQAPPIGAFGWLEKPGQLNLSSFEPEFIQAPSMQQAATAGILRNASINNGEDGNIGAFQINLSSSQVQKGLWYLEGLRQGHIAGELLGYRLERMIYEESRNNPQITMSDVYELRDAYPLEIQKSLDDDSNNTSILTIIDGEKFLAADDTPSKFDDIKNRLNQIKDAASDIALSEVINADSNPELRAGWLDFMEGKVLPPREEFIRTRRTGTLHGTKVILPILPPEDPTSYNASINPRVLADPILACFCDSLMPDIGSREISVELGVKQGKAKRSMIIFARELGVDSIDLVMGGENELTRRIRAHVVSCWKENDPEDLTIASPCNILGKFPDFDTTDEILNEVRVRILPVQSADDTLDIHAYLSKAKLIQNLIHQNQSNTSGATVHPSELPIIRRQKSGKVDLQKTAEELASRFERIISRLLALTVDLTIALGPLKKRLMIAVLLKSIHQMLQRISTTAEATENKAIFNKITDALSSMQDTDADIDGLLADTQIQGRITELGTQIASSNAEVGNLVSSLKTGMMELEENYGKLIENSAKELLIDPKLRLAEISRFGIAKALSAFPDSPTVVGARKIEKTLTRIHSMLTGKLISLLETAPELASYLQVLKILYQHSGEINDLLIHDHAVNAAQKLVKRLPLTSSQVDFLVGISFQNENYFDSLRNILIAEIENASLNLTFNSEEANLESLLALLKRATDKEKMVILTPYLRQSASDARENWQLDLSNLNPVSGRGRLEQYQKVRPAVSNLFSVFGNDQAYKLYRETGEQSLDDEAVIEELQSSNMGDTDYFYFSNNSTIESPYLSFLSIDEWMDGIPNSVETSGVAIRFNTPQSEAPNVCLIAVPPNFRSESESWSPDLMVNTVYEAIELMKIRMVCNENNSFMHLLNLLFNRGFFQNDALLHQFTLDENGLAFDYEIDDPLFPIAAPPGRLPGRLSDSVIMNLQNFKGM